MESINTKQILCVAITNNTLQITNLQSLDTEQQPIYQEEAKQILNETGSTKEMKKINTKSGLWVIKQEEQIGYLLLLHKNISQKDILNYLNNLKDIFNSRSSSPSSKQQQVKNLIQCCNKGSESKIGKVEESVEMVKTNLQSGLKKILTNQDTLNNIDGQSDDLLKKATSFNKGAATLRHKMQRQQRILRLALFLVFLIIVTYIYFMYIH